MDKSHLPLLKKKKMAKEGATKESLKKEKEKPFQEKSHSGKDSSFARVKNKKERVPDKTDPKQVEPSTVNDGRCTVTATEEEVKTPQSPVDWEWSKYMVRGGQPSDAYQRFVPGKMVGGLQEKDKLKFAADQTTPKLELPHQVIQQCFASKLNSLEGHSPSAFRQDLRIHGFNGQAHSVFTFDHEKLDDADCSPIYHELDPLGAYNPSVHHTYQSITEIREEIERLQTSSGNGAAAVAAVSGLTKSPVNKNSGSILSSAQNGSSERSLSKTLPSHLSRHLVPKSPTLVPAPHSPTAPSHMSQQQGSRGQSIFSKLWLQKKSAPAAKGATGTAARNGETVAISPTTQNHSLEAICIDVPKVSIADSNYSTVYALTSPPASAASPFTACYQQLGNGPSATGKTPQSQTTTSFYGMNSCRNFLNSFGNAKRSLSDSTTSNSSGHKNKGCSKSGVAHENLLPWRTCRDLSPVKRKPFAGGWDVVRFGEQLDSHICGGGDGGGGGGVSLETFKHSGSNLSHKVNKDFFSSPCRQCPSKALGRAVVSASKRETSAAKKKLFQKDARHVEIPNGSTREIDQLPQTPSKCLLSRSQLSKSQENVLSTFPLDLFCTSPPGSFESLLSEDDVFLPGSNERLNMLSPPPLRTTFSSPSCGIRMAELRAGRRKSDSKSPSPEPMISTPPPPPPPYLPFHQIPAPCHIETVAKQDVAVQTSPIKSPVRLGGKASHRYMHTIIEEDHSDQMVSSAGKYLGDNRSVEQKLKKITSEILRVDNKVDERAGSVLASSNRSTGTAEMDELHAFGGESDTLLEIISMADGDSLSSDGSTSKIKLSNISCSEGIAEDDATRSAPDLGNGGSSVSLQPVCSLKELGFAVERALQMSCPSVEDDDKLDNETEENNARHGMGSETESATPSPVSIHEAETRSRRRPAESSRSKASKLRPPKPAKCIAFRIIDGQNGATITTNQCREDFLELHRISSQHSKARVSEIRPLVAPVKPAGDTLQNIALDVTRNQPLIKQASVRSIDSIGAASQVALDGKDSKPSNQQTSKVQCSDAEVTLKSSHSSVSHKSPVLPGCREASAEQKRGISQVKSPSGLPSASGSRDRIDTIVDVSGNGNTTVQPSTELGQTNPCLSIAGSKPAGNSQSCPLKYDAVMTTRHSSLSSSLTSSSSSVLSTADSESENASISSTRSRKDTTSSSIGRPSNFKSSSVVADTGEKCNKTNKPIATVEGKSLEKSRLAVPKININRCKERLERTVVQKQESLARQNIPAKENCCDDDDKNKFSS